MIRRKPKTTGGYLEQDVARQPSVSRGAGGETAAEKFVVRSAREEGDRLAFGNHPFESLHVVQ